MERRDWLADGFIEHRDDLRDVAERILGSLREANEVVEEAWLRLSRSEANPTDDLAEWLAAMVTRVSHDRLRWRSGSPALADRDECDPHGLLADSLGLALVTVLESMPPAERRALALHEFSALPLSETASLVGQTADATRELVSRARARLRGSMRLP